MNTKTLSLFIEIRKSKESLDKSNLSTGVQETLDAVKKTVVKFSENFNVCTLKLVTDLLAFDSQRDLLKSLHKIRKHIKFWPVLLKLWPHGLNVSRQISAGSQKFYN